MNQRTQALLSWAHIFGALKNNGIVVIDELETGLHPEAVKKLLITLLMRMRREGSADIFFARFGFYEKFDMQQIFLVEKR
jgi:hypothetical protein